MSSKKAAKKSASAKKAASKATKKRSATKKSAQRPSSLKNGRAIAKKAGGRKGGKKSARTVAKKSASGSWALTNSSSQSELGTVYVIRSKGGKKIKTHTAKKATGTQILRSLGISKSRTSSARSILDRLEAKGRISKA